MAALCELTVESESPKSRLVVPETQTTLLAKMKPQSSGICYRGMTLIELLSVIALLAILAAMLLPAGRGNPKRLRLTCA